MPLYANLNDEEHEKRRVTRPLKSVYLLVGVDEANRADRVQGVQRKGIGEGASR